MIDVPPLNDFVPLTFPYSLGLVTHAIGQDIDVVMEHQELGWFRHAVCPLNVSDDDLGTHPLRAAESMGRLLSREREPTRTERIAHVIVAGYMDKNGYRLQIPEPRIGEYRELMKMIRASAASTEHVAMYLARHLKRRENYVRPNVPLAKGYVLMTAPSFRGQDAGLESVARWYEALRKAMRDAGKQVGLDLELICPALVQEGDPRRVLAAWNETFRLVDGQIVVGFTGDTTVAGYEQVLLGLGRPWTWMKIGDTDISTPLRSWQMLTDGVISKVTTPENAARLAKAWIEREASRFALSIYRRETTQFLAYRVHLEMLRRWVAEDVDRVRVARVAGVSIELIDHILVTPVLFTRTPLETLDAIAAALGIAFDTSMAARPMGLLEDLEERALKTYVSAAELPGELSLDLRRHGARLSGIERRRLGLSAPEGWETLHREFERQR